ncbi:MAG TPA: hypothetical protein VGH11_01170 [Jatrophihabitans sp.]|jgi:hypothetical protein
MLIWYLARGAGLAAFLWLSVATALGAYTARRSASMSVPALERRVVLQYLHRAAAMAGIVLLIGHMSLLLADSYAHVGWLGALVPFASGYRPLAVTLGLLAMYLLVTVAVTGMLRARFAVSARGARLWRGIHLGSYLAWAASAWHFMLAGTDSSQWWARAVLFTGIGLVFLGLVGRLADRHLITTRTVAPGSASGQVTGSGRHAGPIPAAGNHLQGARR